MDKDVIRRVAGLVVAGQTKQANLGRMFMGGLRGIGRGAKAVAETAFTRPNTGFGAAGTRSFSPGRTATTLGLGSFAGGHINNAMADRGLSPQQRFAKYRAQYDSQSANQISQMNSAAERGDYDSAESLSDQLATDNFGGSPWSLGGLNPFAQRGAGYHRGQMVGAEEDMKSHFGNLTSQYNDGQRKLQTIQARLQQHAARPGMTPQSRQGIEASMTHLKNQMAIGPQGMSPEMEAYRRSMLDVGAPDPFGGQPPQQPQPPSGPGQPAGQPPAIPSTQATAGGASQYFNPNDFRVRPVF